MRYVITRHLFSLQRQRMQGNMHVNEPNKISNVPNENEKRIEDTSKS
jgi:hypothetical protein